MSANSDLLGTLLHVPQETFCEHILCLERGHRDTDWWTNLVDPAIQLFDPPGRLRSVPFDRCGAEVERAVASGCRPIVFVARPVDWPEVYDTLGRYRNFALLYVRGRDDQQMRDLLHQPSPEILAVYQSYGRVLVPDLAYGKALDRLLPVSLGDFLRVQPSRSDGPVSSGAQDFRYVSRLNAFRQLHAILDSDARTVHLVQSYLQGDRSQTGEACDLPIRIQDITLRFPGGECHIDQTQDELAASVVAWLGLSVADIKPWTEVVATRLTRISGDAGAYLTLSLQAALAGLARSRDALDALWLRIDEMIQAPPAPRRRRLGVQVCGIPSTRQPVDSTAVLLTEVRSTGNVLQLNLDWRPSKEPAKDPKLTIFLENDRREEKIALSRVSAQWSQDWTDLTLQLQGLSLKRPEVAWRWDEESESLELRFRAMHQNL